MSAVIVITRAEPRPPVDENPIITCPACGFTAPLIDGFSYLPDTVDLLECGSCSAQID